MEKIQNPSFLPDRRRFISSALWIIGMTTTVCLLPVGKVGAVPFKPVVRKSSPKEFGARGDGVSDDTTAIQSAINARDVVYLEAGIYRCSNALEINKSHFTMYGEGELHFEQDFVGGGITIAGHVKELVLDGFSIRLLRNISGKSFCGVFSIPESASITASRISNLKIYGAAFGINVASNKDHASAAVTNTSLQAFEIMGRQQPTMLATMDGRNLIAGNSIRDSLFTMRIGSGGAHGIFLRGSGYNIVNNNQIENMQGGILAASAGVVANNVILNCYDDNGIYCAGSVGLSIQGNYIENTKADGIAFNHAKNCMAIGNQVVGAGNASFRVQSSQHISISGNVCNSKGGSGAYVRSFIDQGSPDASSDISIVNNHFLGGIKKGNAFAFGAVPISEPYRNWRISDNHVSEVDVTALAGAFYGPYALVNFGADKRNVNLVVSDNFFTGIVPSSSCDGKCVYIRNATTERGNVFDEVMR